MLQVEAAFGKFGAGIWSALAPKYPAIDLAKVPQCLTLPRCAPACCSSLLWILRPSCLLLLFLALMRTAVRPSAGPLDVSPGSAPHSPYPVPRLLGVWDGHARAWPSGPERFSHERLPPCGPRGGAAVLLRRNQPREGVPGEGFNEERRLGVGWGGEGSVRQCLVAPSPCNALPSFLLSLSVYLFMF